MICRLYFICIVWAFWSCNNATDTKYNEDLPELVEGEGQSGEGQDEPVDQECGQFEFNDGGYINSDDLESRVLSPCEERWHADAGGQGQRLLVETLEYEVNQSGVEIRIENLSNETIVDWTDLSLGRQYLIDLDYTGEFFVGLRNGSSTKTAEYTLSISCVEGCDSEYSRYPIVFFHGLAGFDTLLNVFDYWVGVEELLRSEGYEVAIFGVSAFDPTPVRAEEWKIHLDTYFEETGARKVNIIAHSQGGLDARYYASILGQSDRVASITTIATPHRGTAIADLLTGVVELGPTDGQIVDALVSGAAELFGSSGESFTEQLAQMTTDSMENFNLDVVDSDDVLYFSWAGKSCRYLQWGCQNEMDGETVSSYFLLSHAYIESQEGDNDGLVSVESSKWGEYLGVLPADHIDEVGHRFDLSSQPFEAAEFYLSEARRLAEIGF